MKTQAIRVGQWFREIPGHVRQGAKRTWPVVQQIFKDMGKAFSWWYVPLGVCVAVVPIAAGWEAGAFAYGIGGAIILTHFIAKILKIRDERNTPPRPPPPSPPAAQS